MSSMLLDTEAKKAKVSELVEPLGMKSCYDPQSKIFIISDAEGSLFGVDELGWVIGTSKRLMAETTPQTYIKQIENLEHQLSQILKLW